MVYGCHCPRCMRERKRTAARVREYFFWFCIVVLFAASVFLITGCCSAEGTKYILDPNSGKVTGIVKCRYSSAFKNVAVEGFDATFPDGSKVKFSTGKGEVVPITINVTPSGVSTNAGGK